MNVGREVTILQGMTTRELRAKREEVFGEPTRAGHKQYLVRRIAWRLQSLAEGGLSERARQRALELARDADIRTTMPRDCSTPAPERTTVAHIDVSPDHRLPLPGAHEAAKVVTAGGGRLALEVGGSVIKDRKDRVTLLKERAGVEVFDAKLDDLLPKPAKKVREGIGSAQLILVTSQEIDELCEQDNITQARRQMDGVLNDLRRGIRVLAELGVKRIVLASDHGHLFAEELSEDMKVEAPGGQTVDLHRRVWVGRGGQADNATLRAPLSALGMEGDFDLATPLTFACFKCKGGARAYFHGGLSPQEALVPLLVLKPLAKPAVRVPAGIVWRLLPGSQRLTTRFFSVQVTGASEGLFDVEPPKVRVELRAKGKAISRAVSASYGFEESTGDVALSRDETDSKKVAPNTVTLMVAEELDQKAVGLYLLDAATGAELARLEKIEVAIAM